MRVFDKTVAKNTPLLRERTTTMGCHAPTLSCIIFGMGICCCNERYVQSGACIGPEKPKRSHIPTVGCLPAPRAFPAPWH
jgi:hypothetical protein